MSITNKLNQIKNAIYGKEVRGAIHDAIKECYDDASVNHDNANMEVKMARGTHNTLNDRLDNVDEIQAQTNAQLSYLKKQIKEINVKYPPSNLKGAKGDGVTDDSPTINALIEYASENNIPRLFFPKGDYLISETIFCPPGLELIGENKLKKFSNIIYTGNSWAIATSGGVGDHRRNRFEKLSIDLKTDAKGGILLGVIGPSNGIIPVQHTLKDIEIHDIKNGQIGIMQKNCSDIYMENVISQWGTGGRGLVITADGNNSGVCTYNNCRFGRINQIDVGLELRHGSGGLDGYTFNGCYFGGKSPIKITGASIVKNVVFNSTHIEATPSEDNSEYCAVDINRAVGITFNSITLYGGGNTGFRGFIFRKDCKSITVNGVDCNEFNNGVLYKNEYTSSPQFSMLQYGTVTGTDRVLIQTEGIFDDCMMLESSSVNIKNIKTSQIVMSSGGVNKSIKYSTSKPTSIGRGDFVFNAKVGEMGSEGSKYVIIGWVGVSTNVAVECRCATGE